MASPQFRYDINALRAVAVTGVVLFHFHTPGLQGGFSGVDVFFVISGFLMTGIITRRLAGGRLSIPDFYAARVRRIIPALAVAVFALLVFAAAVVDPLTAKRIGRSAATSVLFVSNIDYFLTQDYFAEAADTNWLLHTWSLSVEWQFYIIYPVVLAIVARFTKSQAALRGILIAGVLVSLAIALAVAVWGAGIVARSSFYLLPARAWEMLFGGMVVMLPAMPGTALTRRLVSAAGFVAILACFSMIGETSIWPTGWTILPVTATAFVLWANHSDGHIARAAPVRLLGLWSYSIYLWHWPIVVAGRYFGLYDGPTSVAVGIALSVVAGAASYYLVEERVVERVFSAGQPRGVAIILTAASAALVFAATVAATTGFQSIRIAAVGPAVRPALTHLEAVVSESRPHRDCLARPEFPGGLEACLIGHGARTTLLLGDSHAAQLLIRYSGKGPSLSRQVLSLTRNGCALLPGADRIEGGQGCRAATDAALKEAASGKYDRVVVLSSWRASFRGETLGHRGRVCFIRGDKCEVPEAPAAYVDAVDQSFAALGNRLDDARRAGAQVFIISSLPSEVEADPRAIYRQSFLTGRLSDPSPRLATWLAEEALSREGVEIAARVSGARLLNATSALCSSSRCALIDGADPRQFDTGHYRAPYLQGSQFHFIDEAVQP